MNNVILNKKIMNYCPFPLTSGQEEAIKLLSTFVTGNEPRQVFLLKGYAGTGKTTLIGALVKALRSQNGRVVLMAPTGRAAKVFSSYSECQASTIHRKIYRQKSILDSSSFQLDRNRDENTLFLVDEASMISNEGLAGTMFGTGRLLDDLVSYVYSGKNCRLLLTGDQAQLPPVGEEESPALSASVISSYGLNVSEYCLDKVMRQEHESGILFNATLLRREIDSQKITNVTTAFRFRLKGFKDIVRTGGEELIEALESCYSRDGIDQTLVLCRSNKTAIMYNNAIRNTILGREDKLCGGESLMIVKNNYFWTGQMARDKDLGTMTEFPSFIANGDIAQVRRVRRHRELYGFNFVDALLSFPDYDDFELEATLLSDTLHSESPSITKKDSERLFHNVMEDYEEIPSKREKMEKLRENPYFNALQIKYAYAVTCHKAQGGQWKNVFIDRGYLPADGRDENYYRWLYTALTRATEKVFLINWPE
ncbi:MAG TPA: AAA family ATPase [Bacteroidaceae bacterium]|nr:AAA family ATPase [Bacteroidaceae bacterium]